MLCINTFFCVISFYYMEYDILGISERISSEKVPASKVVITRSFVIMICWSYLAELNSAVLLTVMVEFELWSFKGVSKIVEISILTVKQLGSKSGRNKRKEQKPRLLNIKTLLTFRVLLAAGTLRLKLTILVCLRVRGWSFYLFCVQSSCEVETEY